MSSALEENSPNITILELRNYLLKPNTTNTFISYFNTNFVAPMNLLGGYTLKQFTIKDVNDRFVWFRGFTDMSARVKFLNDFYIKSPTWKKFGPGANDMMINSDNVYLLRLLNREKIREINNSLFKTNKGFTVVEFYVCNSTLNKVIELFNADYIPFLKTLEIEDISLWVSEMLENDFPQLPVFQDKNLLVIIANYNDEKEYRIKQKQIKSMSFDLNMSMKELITQNSNLLLINNNYDK